MDRKRKRCNSKDAVRASDAIQRYFPTAVGRASEAIVTLRLRVYYASDHFIYYSYYPARLLSIDPRSVIFVSLGCDWRNHYGRSQLRDQQAPRRRDGSAGSCKLIVLSKLLLDFVVQSSF